MQERITEVLILIIILQALDADHDGYISKTEFASMTKCMSPKQVLINNWEEKVILCCVSG